MKTTIIALILLVIFCGCSRAEGSGLDIPFKIGPDALERTGNRVTGGGYIAEHEGQFYFANHEDNNKLYRMDTGFGEKQKLNDCQNDTFWLDIQFADDKLFYLQNTKTGEGDNFEWETTLYSYDLIHGAETRVFDPGVSTNSYVVYEGWIYYSSREEMELFKSRLDGSDVQLLIEPYGEQYDRCFNSLQIVEGRLFLNDAERILSFGLDYLRPGAVWDDPEMPLPEGVVCPYLFLAYDQYVFYINRYTAEFCRFNSADLSIISANTSGSNVSNPNMEVLGEGIREFTISENVIYYSTFDREVYKMGLDGKEPGFIEEGYAPNVIGNYLFFYDKNDKMVCLLK